MEITFKDHQKKVPLNSSQIIKITKLILRHEGVQKATLSIVFVSHQKIKALNKRYLHRNHATDVLAFDLSEKLSRNKKIIRKPKEVTGDIIISTDAALKNIKRFNTALTRELALYIVHGILHLLGYDDHRAVDIKKIRKKEQEILGYLGTKIQKLCLKR